MIPPAGAAKRPVFPLVSRDIAIVALQFSDRVFAFSIRNSRKTDQGKRQQRLTKKSGEPTMVQG